MGESKQVLELGGIGGLLAGVLLILSIVIQQTLPQLALADVEGFIMRTLEHGATLALYASLFLAATILALPLYLALHRTLREASPAFASLGGVLGIAGLVLLGFFFAYATIYGAPALADLYINATTDAERTTIVFLWLNGRALLNAAIFVGILFLGLSFTSLGVTMLGNQDFPNGFGWVSVVLGLFGIVTTSFSQVEPTVGMLGILALVIFLLLFGWKVYRLSRSAESAAR